MIGHAVGFPPCADKESELLILGSFPSVKSRAVEFYYGNKQNRFWKTVCSFFGEIVPEDTEGKKAFLHRHKIALWDVITECDIEGSSDASIVNEKIADVLSLVEGSRIRAIICNGTKSYSLFEKCFPSLLPIVRKLSSTSPANPRFSIEEWNQALAEIFP